MKKGWINMTGPNKGSLKAQEKSLGLMGVGSRESLYVLEQCHIMKKEVFERINLGKILLMK